MEWRERERDSLARGRAARRAAAFSTRLGGVSEGPSRASTSASSPATTATRCSRTAAGSPPPLGLDPARVVIGRQVHGAEIAPPRRAPQDPSPFADPAARCPEVDGHVTAEAGPGAARLRRRLPAGRARRAPAAWRCCTAAGAGSPAGSSAAGPTAVERARRPRSGPGSGPAATRSATRCSTRFADARRGDRRRAHARPGRGRPPAARARPASSEIEAAGLCTSCEPELFFSHRRDGGRTGRQAGLAWIESG